MNLNEQIRDYLLRTAGVPLPPSLISAIDNAAEERPPTRAIPLKEVRDIYRVGAQINCRNGSPIIGFDQLLYALETVDDQPICIYSLSSSAGLIIVFTDAKVENVIGVLFKSSNKGSQTPAVQSAQAVSIT